MATLNEGVIQEYYWQSVAGNGSINMAVLQVGNSVIFLQVGSNAALSAGAFGQQLDLDSFAVSGAPSTASVACQFASGYGYLFIAHPFCDPIYVVFNPVTQVFTFNSIVIQQRDISGLTETPVNPVGYRPPTLNDQHHYNLINQGWFCQATQWNDGAGDFETLGLVDGYITLFYTQLGEVGGGSVYPSNSDVWYLFKAANGGFSPYTTLSTIGSYNSIAPKGYFILNSFYQDRNAAFNAAAANVGSSISINSIPVVSSGYQRPSAIAFFAGRVFYAGVQAQGYSNQIYYSQIIQDPTFLPLCYQANDPTASDTGVADLVDSDGGVLVLPEIGQVYRLFSIAYSLIIFASNGVWALAGSTGSGFKATDFSVSKISSVGMISNQGFVDMDGIPIWWNLDGIFTLEGNNPTSPNGQTGTTVVNMTDPVIKTFIDTIPAQSKAFTKGSYNRGLYTIYWLYSTNAPTDIDSQYHYTNCLCHNTNTKAWYDWTLPNGTSTGWNITDLWVSGIITVQGQGTSYMLTNTGTVEQSIVTDNSDATVQTSLPVVTQQQSVTKFLIQYEDSNGNFNLTFAESNDITYFDFISMAFESFFTTGYNIDGQAVAKFQAPYVIVYANDELANGFVVNVRWDFANDLIITTNKIGSFRTIQSEGGSHDWASYRCKLRGVGRAMQLSINSVQGLPFEIAGWGIEISTNSGA